MRQKIIFARYKILTGKELENNLDGRAQFFNITKDQYLDMYIKGRIGDMGKSTEIIFREKQRVKKAQKCVQVALSVMTKGAGKNVRDVTEKYYNDLLDSVIAEIKSKVKND